jgi:hypothetical protein
MRLINNVILISLFFLLQSSVFPNDRTLSQSEIADNVKYVSLLTIDCNIEGAEIFIDTTYLGTTPLKDYPIHPGSYLLLVISPNSRNWYRTTFSDSIVVHESENIKKYIILDNIYYINSVPSGAKVLFNDSIIGITPMILSGKINQNFIRIFKDGYQQVSIPLDKNETHLNVTLFPLASSSDYQNPYLSSDGTKLPISIYLSAGASLVTGVAAALYKIQADDNYKKYRLTADETYLKKVKKFDLIAGISLAACEVSSFILAYLVLDQ